MENRTIRNAISGKEKVYFILSNDETKRQFVQMAIKEGCTLLNETITDFIPERIMSVDKNMNICFVGQARHIIMRCNQSNHLTQKIDFEKYLRKNKNRLSIVDQVKDN